MDQQKFRIFFALWPDREAAQHLSLLAHHLQPQCGGRLVPLQNLHLTLSFIGDVSADECEILTQAVAGLDLPPFRLRLDRCGFFSRQRLLWAGCRRISRRLTDLANALEKQVEKVTGRKRAQGEQGFLPHVTLLRNISRFPPQSAQKMLIEWECRDFMLIRSELRADGAVYSPMKSWPLVERGNAGRKPVDND